MPCWYYEKKELRNTPSIHDGIDYDTEQRYRKEGARFIFDTGTKMDLGYSTMATGVVYFHRFYMFHSFRQFPRYVTACCCLFLAGKVEETPKKCNDIIQIAKTLLSKQQFQTFGDDPKEEVMTLERILLQTIKFDLQVEHPYSYLLKYAKCLKGDKNKLQKMVQMAWTFVNDSLSTTLCLQWEPEVIAVALMYLSGKLSKFEVQDWAGRTSKHLRWWDMFVEDVTMDLLEDICHQVLDLYSQPQTSGTPDSPPLLPRSPSNKKPRLEQPASPSVPHHSPAPSVIAVKGVKMEIKQGLPPSAVENIPLCEKVEMLLLPKGGEAATFPYGTSYMHGASHPAFPANYSTPIPVTTVPSASEQPTPSQSLVNTSAYVPYPSQFTPVASASGQFFACAAPTQPYFPPPGAS